MLVRVVFIYDLMLCPAINTGHGIGYLDKERATGGKCAVNGSRHSRWAWHKTAALIGGTGTLKLSPW